MFKKRLSKTIKEGLALLFFPLFVVLGFVLYVLLMNQSSGLSPLDSRISPQIAFTGDLLEYSTSFSGENISEVEPAKDLDLIYVVDVSDSISGAIDEMKQAIHQSVIGIQSSNTEKVRYSLLEFDDEARLLVGWTNNPDDIFGAISTPGGGTAIHTVFPEIDKLLQTSRKTAQKIIIFYSDGVFGGGGYVQKAQKIREESNQLVDMYAVMPNSGNQLSLQGLTGSAKNVYSVTNVNQLPDVIAYIPYISMNAVGHKAVLSYTSDTENFIYKNIENTPWQEENNRMQVRQNRLPAINQTFTQTLSANGIGLWSIGLDRVGLDYMALDGKQVKLQSATHPRVLILSYWLFLLWLPALLWLLLHHLLHRKSQEEDKQAVPPQYEEYQYITKAQSFPDKHKTDFIPSLFIYIGSEGIDFLKKLEDRLEPVHGNMDTLPCELVCLSPSMSENSSSPNINIIQAPEQIRNVDKYLQEYIQYRKKASWFNSEEHIDTGMDARDLNGYAEVDRQLARLALHEWLQSDDTLVDELKELLNSLEAKPSIGEKRQIVLIANEGMSVSGAWLLDLAVILRRLINERGGNAAQHFPPEIIGLLWRDEADDSDNYNANHLALSYELESAQSTGSHPHHNSMFKGHKLLDRLDNQAPFNWILKHPSFEKEEAQQAAQVTASSLVEPMVRNKIFNYQINTGETRAVKVTELKESLHIWQALISNNILLYLLSGKVLLDIDYAGDTLELLKPNSRILKEHFVNDISKGLDDILPDILQLSDDRQQNNKIIWRFSKLIEEEQWPDSLWWKQAFVSLFNRQLLGEYDSEKQEWLRKLHPGEAIAILRNTSEALDQLPTTSDVQKIPQLVDKLQDANNTIKEILLALSSVTDKLLAIYGQYWTSKSHLFESLMESNSRIANSIKLAEDLEKKVNQISMHTLSAWLNTGIDSVASELRQYIFIKLSKDKTTASLILPSDNTDNRCKEGDLDVGIVLLSNQIKAIVQQYMDIDAEKMLENIKGELPKVIDKLASNIKQDHTTTDGLLHVVSVFPQRKASLVDRMKDALEINIEANYDLVSSVNKASIRYLSFHKQAIHYSDFDPQQTLPFIKFTEVNAERNRKQIENEYQVNLPLFPLKLRLAMANRDSFKRFAQKYSAGNIHHCQDIAGKQQWCCGNKHLTQGDADTLADAAITFSRLSPEEQDKCNSANISTDIFKKMEHWRENQNIEGMHPDIFTQFAMKIVL